MYKNAGGKVKGLATTIAVIMMVIFGFFGLITMFESFFVGLLTILFGCLSAWLIGLMLAAFGELVENTYYIRKQLTEGNPPVNAAPADSTSSAPATCPNCGSPRKGNSAFCGFCGTRL